MKSIYKYLFSLTVLLAINLQVNSQTIIQMEKDGGVYKIPCEINGLRLKLIFDTGAANVCISESIASMMLDNGYIDKSDIKGTGASVVADGRIVDNTKINIRTLKIGNQTLYNVEAIVMHQQSAPLLLGQSAIQKLGKISISGNLLILSRNDESPNSNENGTNNANYKDTLSKANEASNGKMYELAVSYYDKCYGNINFDINTKWSYAECLFQIKEYSRAVALFDEISNKMQQNLENWLLIVYRMTECYLNIGNYELCVIIGQNALLKCEYDSTVISLRKHIMYILSKAYKQKNGVVRAERFILDELERYLSYRNMASTDCWNYGYKNDYIAELYGYLAVEIITAADYEWSKKYMIIAAAWGNKLAINVCNQLYLSYLKKPANAEYIY